MPLVPLGVATYAAQEISARERGALMLTDQFILDIAEELFVDNFAGGGGASTGIEMGIGRHVDLAFNHNLEALGMHAMNHPQTLHIPEDVFVVDPFKVTRGRPVGGAWFSPDCKHFSKAKGGKPVSKKIRGLALVMLNWIATVRPRVMFMENVEEIQTWGPLLANGRPDPNNKGRTFQAFLDCLGSGLHPDHPDLPEILEVCGKHVTKAQLCAGFGYHVEGRELRACDYGAPTIRKRYFMIARCDGVPITWPKATHAAPKEAKKQKLKPWRTAAECIDWARPCPSIFLSKAEAKAARCKRPLVKASLARIAKGIGRYVLDADEPFLVSVTHQGGDRVESAAEPFRTITGAHRGEKAVVSPVLANVANGKTTGRGPNVWAPTEPVRTVTSVNGFAVVAPVLARTAHGDVDKKGKKRGRGSLPVTEPLPTTLATRDIAVVAPVLAYAQHGGAVRPADAPMHTIAASAKDQNQVIAVHMVRQFGESVGSEAAAPVGATTAGGGGKTGLVACHLTKFNTGSVGSPMTEPVPTVPACSHKPDTRGGAATPHGLVAASIVKMRGDPATHAPGHGAGEPIHTISAAGQHHSVVAVALAQANTGVVGHDVREPFSTISSKGAQQQVIAATAIKYYGNESEGHAVNVPAGTVTTRDRHAHVEARCARPLLTLEELAGAQRVAAFLREHGIEFEGEFATVGDYVIVDIGMRMLTPRELFRAQGFPDSYIIDRAIIVGPDGVRREVILTKEAQIRMCGNSVCPPVAAALVRANLPEMVLKERAA